MDSDTRKTIIIIAQSITILALTVIIVCLSF